MVSKRIELERYDDYRIFSGFVSGVRKLQATPGLLPEFQPNTFEIKIPIGRYGYFHSASITGPKLKRAEDGTVTKSWYEQLTRVYRPGQHWNTMPRWLSQEIRQCARFVWREEELTEKDAKGMVKLVRKKGYHKLDNDRVRKLLRGYTTMSDEELRKAILKVEFPRQAQ